MIKIDDKLVAICEEIYELVKPIIKQSVEVIISTNPKFLKFNLNELVGDKITRQNGESRVNFIKRLFREHPISVINNILDNIDTYHFNEKINIHPSNYFYDYKNDTKFFVHERITIPNIKYLTHVSKLEVQILDEMNQQFKSIKFNLNLQEIDSFVAEVIIFGEIELDGLIGMDIVDSMCIDIKFDYMGLLSENILPVWLEYIIEGAIYQNRKNEKLAIFNYFVAFDSFIQETYHSISNSYDKSELSNFLKHCLDNTLESIKSDLVDTYFEIYNPDYTYSETDDWYDLYLEDLDEFYIKNESIITSDMNFYFSNYKKMIKYLNRKLDEEIEYYSNNNRRLVDEKLKDIELILGININAVEFSGMSTLKGRLYEIEKYRHAIAHGSSIIVEPRGDEFYVIMSYILSLLYFADIHGKRWKAFIIE